MFIKLLKSFPILIGAYSLSSTLYTNLTDAYNHFYRIPLRLHQIYNDGRYFLIAGATCPLGKALARDLANKGIPLILVSQNEESLNKIQAELFKEFAAKVEVLPFDFENSENINANYEKLFLKLEQFELAGVINNVSSLVVKDYEKTTAEEVLKLVKTNVISSVFLSKFALDKFKAKKDLKYFLSTNSSVFGAYPHPHLSLFSASQAFRSNLARSLRMERPKNVEIILVEPALFEEQENSTGFPNEWKDSHRWKWFISETDEVAQEVVKRFGQEKVIYGTFRHWVYHSLLRNCQKGVNYLTEGNLLNI